MRDDPNYRESWTCEACGRTLRHVVLPVRCNCTAPRPVDARGVVDISPCQGLGDVVAVILGRLGIRKRWGCGCARRQSWLNRAVPFPRWVRWRLSRWCR